VTNNEIVVSKKRIRFHAKQLVLSRLRRHSRLRSGDLARPDCDCKFR
jgi:hypothetical protein